MKTYPLLQYNHVFGLEGGRSYHPFWAICLGAVWRFRGGGEAKPAQRKLERLRTTRKILYLDTNQRFNLQVWLKLDSSVS
jgi:hypothetical protein